MDANTSIDQVLLSVALPAATVAALVLALSVAACLVEATIIRLGHRPAWRWSPSPRLVRHLVFACFGLSLAVALPSNAVAETAATPVGAHDALEQGTDHPCPSPCTGLDGLRLPDLPASHQRGATGVTARNSWPNAMPHVADDQTIVVRSGDCLWSLATDLVGAGASAADVAAAVDALYRRNADRIGPDPDLIFPGTRLITPEATR